VNGTTSPFETIQREEVGTILKVTPHISEGDTVQLKIEQEDSSPGAKLTDSADISTNKRSIKTTILIEDGGVIVLGGLMSGYRHRKRGSRARLGAIPLLGNLFKSRSGSRQKKNLLVFIRPRILRDDVQTETVSEGKYNEMRQEEGTLHKGTSRCCRARSSPRSPPRRRRRRRANRDPVRRPTRRAPQPVFAAPAAPRTAASAPATAELSAGTRRAGAGGPPAVPFRRRPHERRMSAALKEPVEPRKLSFPFAKRHGVLVRGIADGTADTVCRPA
jgi:hypothetical protein